MPRANRYILPGYVYHLTHRCHNRSFLLRFAIDRNAYLLRLRKSAREYQISILNYSLTCNHTHMLAITHRINSISRLMQKLEGQFAVHYNLRKDRSGAFWGERFHCTMVESGEHLWNCMKYIDLNMVRAGVVGHPVDWRWCGYHELVGRRRRYRLLDLRRVVELFAQAEQASFAQTYEAAIAQAIAERRLNREPIWTQSIAVGSKSFVRGIAHVTKKRRRLEMEENVDGVWYLREAEVTYGINRLQRVRIHAR